MTFQYQEFLIFCVTPLIRRHMDYGHMGQREHYKPQWLLSLQVANITSEQQKPQSSQLSCKINIRNCCVTQDWRPCCNVVVSHRCPAVIKIKMGRSGSGCVSDISPDTPDTDLDVNMSLSRCSSRTFQFKYVFIYKLYWANDKSSVCMTI